MESARFIYSDMERAILEEACLIGADLSETNLKFAKLKEAKLLGANLFNANLRESELDNVDFQYSNLYKTKFSGSNVQYAIISSKRINYKNIYEIDENDLVCIYNHLMECKIDEVILTEIIKKIVAILKDESRYKKASEIYRELKNTYRQNGIYDWESNYHFRERRALTNHLKLIGRKKEWKYSCFNRIPRLKNFVKNRFKWFYLKMLRIPKLSRFIFNVVLILSNFPRKLYYHLRWIFNISIEKLCGYGEHYWRVAIWMGLLILFYGLIYLWLGPTYFSGRGINDLFDYFYFSIVTFTTLGFGDVQPGSNTAILRSLAASEAIIGAGLMALFIVVLARRLVR